MCNELIEYLVSTEKQVLVLYSFRAKKEFWDEHFSKQVTAKSSPKQASQGRVLLRPLCPNIQTLFHWHKLVNSGQLSLQLNCHQAIDVGFHAWLVCKVWLGTCLPVEACVIWKDLVWICESASHACQSPACRITAGPLRPCFLGNQQTHSWAARVNVTAWSRTEPAVPLPRKSMTQTCSCARCINQEARLLRLVHTSLQRPSAGRLGVICCWWERGAGAAVRQIDPWTLHLFGGYTKSGVNAWLFWMGLTLGGRVGVGKWRREVKKQVWVWLETWM